MTDGLRVYLGSMTGLEVWNASGRDWTRQGSFLDAPVRGLAGWPDRPGAVFACVRGDGIHRTTDSGATWEKVFDGDARSIAVDPSHQDVVYAGTEPVHLYRSDDSGDSWSEVDGLQRVPEAVKKQWWFPQPPHEGHVLKILIDDEDPRIMYLCLEHGGVVRSLDGGETWEDVSAGVPYLDIHAIARHPDRPGAYFIATARGFFQTDDPARGWTPADSGMPWADSPPQNYAHDFLVLPKTARTSDVSLIVAGANGSPGHWRRPSKAEGVILRSDDGAKSWHQLTTGLPERPPGMAWSLVQRPGDPDSLLAGYGDYTEATGDVYTSADRGDSWDRVSATFPSIRSMWLEVA